MTPHTQPCRRGHPDALVVPRPRCYRTTTARGKQRLRARHALAVAALAAAATQWGAAPSCCASRRGAAPDLAHCMSPKRKASASSSAPGGAVRVRHARPAAPGNAVRAAAGVAGPAAASRRRTSCECAVCFAPCPVAPGPPPVLRRVQAKRQRGIAVRPQHVGNEDMTITTTAVRVGVSNQHQCARGRRQSQRVQRGIRFQHEALLRRGRWGNCGRMGLGVGSALDELHIAFPLEG